MITSMGRNTTSLSINTRTMRLLNCQDYHSDFWKQRDFSWSCWKEKTERIFGNERAGENVTSGSWKKL